MIATLEAAPLGRETGTMELGEEPTQTDETSDAALLEAVATGNLQAFGVIYSRYAGVVHAFLSKRTPEPEWAADLSQEIFTKVWQKAGGYRPSRGTVSQWVFGIARYSLFDALRRWKCLGRALDSAMSPESAGLGDPRAGLPDPERTLSLKRALDGLPPDQKRAVELVYFEGLTLKDCARKVGAPLGTVKWRVFAAHKALRAALEEREMNREAVA